MSWLEGATQPMGPRRIWNVRLSFRPSTRIAVALVVLACSTPATALDPAKQLSQFGYRAWTQQQGLPQDSVRVIAQAPDGALWLGTDEGLARFDGTDFTVFRQSRDGLPGSFITALVAARDGSVWVGTLAGVSRLKDGRFTQLQPRQRPGHADGQRPVRVAGRHHLGRRRPHRLRLSRRHHRQLRARAGRARRGPAQVGPDLRRRAVRRRLFRGRAVRRRALPTLCQPRRADRRVRHVDHPRQRRRALDGHHPGPGGRGRQRAGAAVRRRPTGSPRRRCARC